MKFLLLFFLINIQVPILDRTVLPINKQILGKWYGQYYAFGSLKEASQLLKSSSKKRGIEQVDFIFNSGKFMQKSKSINSSKLLNETCNYSLGNDSTLWIGNAIYKIVEISKHKLVLYSTEINGGQLRLFTREDSKPVKDKMIGVKF